MSRYLGMAFVILLAACASPRYSYYFPQPETIGGQLAANPGALLIERPEVLLLQVSAFPGPEVSAPGKRAGAYEKRSALGSGPVIKLKTESDQPDDALAVKDDPDLRRSVIFAAGGLVALIIGGNVFWVVGSLSLMIGLIFAIKWLLRK